MVPPKCLNFIKIIYLQTQKAQQNSNTRNIKRSNQRRIIIQLLKTTIIIMIKRKFLKQPDTLNTETNKNKDNSRFLSRNNVSRKAGD